MPESFRHILIVGGGFGGLEAALYLRHTLGPDVKLTLISEQSVFVFRPYLSYVPFGLWPDRLEIDLLSFCDAQGVRFIQDRVDAVLPDRKQVLVGQTHYGYDALLLATGVSLGPESVPGLYTHAYLPWRTTEAVLMQGALERLAADSRKGAHKQVVFLVPPGNLWAGPLYEMAFMFERWLQVQTIRAQVRVQFLTHQSTLMPDFGQDVQTLLEGAFNERHIHVQTGQTYRSVTPEAVVLGTGAEVAFDLLVAAPTYAPSVHWTPLPTDEAGFLKTETASRQVQGYPDVYAIGDASDYPIKQAYLALLQADAAAEHLCARMQGRTPTFGFEPMGVWLMEQLDQALLATVPLTAPHADSGDAQGEGYFVGKMPVGENRRLHIRAHLPWRFDAANPLYAGLLWKGTETGLKVLSYLEREGPQQR